VSGLLIWAETRIHGPRPRTTPLSPSALLVRSWIIYIGGAVTKTPKPLKT
jgi:hypothetical protein